MVRLNECIFNLSIGVLGLVKKFIKGWRTKLKSMGVSCYDLILPNSLKLLFTFIRRWVMLKWKDILVENGIIETIFIGVFSWKRNSNR